MSSTGTRLPVGTQFSPDLISLPEFLKIAVAHSGDRAALRQAVWQAPVRIKPKTVPPTKRLLDLPLDAAVAYQLLKKGTLEVTEVASRLASLPETDQLLEFARHMLLNLGFARVLEAIDQMTLDGLTVGADSLARYLNAQGFTVSEHNGQTNTGRMWLERAGVLSGWTIDVARKAAVMGLDDADIQTLSGLTQDERDYLRAICVVDPVGPVSAATVRAQAEMMTGRTLPRSSAVINFLNGLQKAGYVVYHSKGTSGGKSATFTTTPKFKAEVLGPFLDHTLKDLDPELTLYYRTPPAHTFRVLDDPKASKHDRGMALEAFAVLVMRRLHLRFVGWRARPADLGYAEVDVVLAGLIGGIATRWQVQCKCVGEPVGNEVIQRELGLLPLTKATHVLIISTAGFKKNAQRFVNRWMRESSVSVYLFGKKEYERLKADPASISTILREQSAAIAAIPRTGIDWEQ